MKYVSRAPKIEAERITLTSENVYAVAIDGKVRLVAGEAFELLYAVENTPAVKLAPKAEPQAKSQPKPQPKRPVKSPAVADGEPRLWQRALKILQDFGPLTHAELATHLHPDEKDVKKRGDSTYAVESDLRSKGLINRVSDNGLDKWAVITENGRPTQ